MLALLHGSPSAFWFWLSLWLRLGLALTWLPHCSFNRRQLNLADATPTLLP